MYCEKTNKKIQRIVKKKFTLLNNSTMYTKNKNKNSKMVDQNKMKIINEAENTLMSILNKTHYSLLYIPI
jgi:hypothetical protein